MFTTFGVTLLWTNAGAQFLPIQANQHAESGNTGGQKLQEHPAGARVDVRVSRRREEKDYGGKNDDIVHQVTTWVTTVDHSIRRRKRGRGRTGAFHRIFGSPTGLTVTGNQLFGAITVQANARYGSALAAGRFDNADDAHELAVGAPFHDVGTAADAGYVDVRFGSATTAEWTQGSPGVPGGAESTDEFGSPLAVGDFSGDGADDLAIGVPSETVGSAGAVNVPYGTPSLCTP